MKEKLILHDLTKEQEVQLLSFNSNSHTVFSAIPMVKSCIGCFGCWTKTPGKCVIKDRANEFSRLMATHEALIIISRMAFGGVSPEIKAVLDRSIGFILPFFTMVRNEMHHIKRFENIPDLKCIFYEKEISQQEKDIAKKLVEANAVNFNSNNYKAVFCNNLENIGAVLK